MADYDPRTVSLYDDDNPAGDDHAYYRALADRAGARRIVDLGCGTGLLTVTLAAPGRTVVGVDPSASMLAVARGRTGGEHVRWVHGDSSALETGSADLVLLTGNTAQHITGEGWTRALADIHRALAPGGWFAFETRNPADRAWERWPLEPPATRASAHGTLTEWMEVRPTDAPGEVELLSHTRFEATGEELVEVQRLAFRDEGTLRRELGAAGLRVDAVWGGWRGEAVSDGNSSPSRLLVIEARRPG